MSLALNKGDRVVYRREDATVEKSVGSRDYVIRLDSGKRMVVDGRKLTQFELIHVETSLPETDVPDNQLEEATVGSSTEEASASAGDDQTETESGEAEGSGEEVQTGTGKPMLARKKFEAMSKKELYNLAQLYSVPGRSTLDIDGLRSALTPLLDLQ